MADDDLEADRATISTVRLLSEVFGLRDECRQHQQTGGCQYDTTIDHGRQAWHDRTRHVRSTWE